MPIVHPPSRPKSDDEAAGAASLPPVHARRSEEGGAEKVAAIATAVIDPQSFEKGGDA